MTDKKIELTQKELDEIKDDVKFKEVVTLTLKALTSDISTIKENQETITVNMHSEIKDAESNSKSYASKLVAISLGVPVSLVVIIKFLDAIIPK